MILLCISAWDTPESSIGRDDVVDPDLLDLEFVVAADPRPLVPEGTYIVSFVGVEKRSYYASAKLYVKFELCEPGAYFGVRLFRAYNYYDKLPVGCDLYKDLVLLHGKRVPKHTKLSVRLFRGKLLRVRVRTVKQDRKQTSLEECRQYSVIDKVIGIEAGVRCI